MLIEWQEPNSCWTISPQVMAPSLLTIRAEWDEEMEVVFSTSVPNRVRVAIPL